MGHLRVMSLAVLLPAAIAISSRSDREPRGHVRQRVPLNAADIMVLCFAALQLLVQVPYESPTNTMRRAVLIGLDMLLPYFVLSRSCGSVAKIKEAFGALAAAAIVLAPLAVLEMFWTAMLFGDFEHVWNTPLMYLPLYRGVLLRAQVTAGHSIVFGYFCAIALCAWWTVKDQVGRKPLRLVGTAMVALALLASLSRGPWLGAIVGMLTFAILGRGTTKGLAKVAGGTFAVLLAILASPYGDELMQYVPFVGTADSESVTYRQRLLEISLALIVENPVLGTPGFIQYLEDLRQGQGIIDLVNGHITIALSYGLLGLGLFLGTFAVVTWRCAIRPAAVRGDEWRQVGVGLSAAIAAAMATLFTASNYLSVTYLYWALAGLGCGLIRLPAVAVNPVQEYSRHAAPAVAKLAPRNASRPRPRHRAQA
jgi:O-antigen ligase